MIWIKRLLLLFAALLLGVVLLVTGAVFFLDDADYKAALGWTAEHFLDSQLEISGPFSISIRRDLLLSSGDIRLQANDGSYSLSVGELDANFRLGSYLRTGTFWINSLTLTDVSLEVEESEGDFDLKDISIPPVVIEKAKLNNLTFDYQELRPGTLHSFKLHELEIDDINDSGPVEIQASGILDGRAFSVTGKLPPLDQMLVDGTPKPVEVTVEGEKISAHLDGSVTDPVNGEGMDLKLELQVAEVHELLEVFGDDIPAVGELQASMAVRGDYEAPRLEAIDARFQREQEVGFTLTGSVENALTGKGMNLHLAGKSDNPSVTSWLLYKKLDRMKSLSLDVMLLEKDEHFFLEKLDASARTSDGLEVTAKGSGELYDDGHVFTKNDAGIDLKFKAPTTAAINLAHLEGIPELGAVSGTLRLMVSQDAIGLYNADVSIGDKKSNAASLQGQVARIPLHDESAVTGIDLKIAISSSDVAALGKRLDAQLPALGPGRADLHVAGDLQNLKLGSAVVSVGSKDGVFISASGKADRVVFDTSELLADARFDVTVSMPNLSDLSDLLDMDVPPLGAAKISSVLTIHNSELVFDNLKVDIGRPDQPTIKANGKVTTMLHEGSSVHIDYDVAVADLVAAYTDEVPEYLGRMHGSLKISDLDGDWVIKYLDLQSSQTRLYQVKLAGGYDDIDKSYLKNVHASLVINDPAALGAALGIDLSGYGIYKGDGYLTMDEKSLTYKATASVGETTSTMVLGGVLRNGKPYFTGKLEIPGLHLKDFGFGAAEASDAPASSASPGSKKPSRQASGSDRIFSREPMDVSILNSFDLDFDLLVDRVDSEKQLEIDSIKGHIRLQDGDLRVDPLSFIVEGGSMDVTFGVNATGVPVYTLTAIADDAKLGPLMSQVQDDVPITGYTNIHTDLTARGHSPHDLAASLNGSVSIGVENAKIPNKYIRLLSVDTFGWAMSQTLSRRKYADLNCVVSAFDVKEGEVTSRALVADGPNLSLGGRIDMNLGKETLDIVLIPSQKKRVFSRIAPVKIKGPMRDPEITAIPAKAAIAEVGGMALMPMVYIPVGLLGKLWSIVDDGDKLGGGCATLEALTAEAEKEVKEEAKKNQNKEPEKGSVTTESDLFD
jgi:hypothetical protein